MGMKGLLLLGKNACASIEPRHFPHIGATDMSKITLCVGFDYHDDSIRVCVMDEDGTVLVNRSLPNSEGEVIDLVSQFGSYAVCAVEACCGAADFAHRLRQHTGWDVRLAHPGYARRLKQSPDKSDHDDAQLLADLVRVKYLPEVWLAPTETRELRRLVRYRQQLKRNRAEIKLQIRALLREERVKPPAQRLDQGLAELVREDTPAQ